MFYYILHALKLVPCMILVLSLKFNLVILKLMNSNGLSETGFNGLIKIVKIVVSYFWWIKYG